MNTHCKKIFHLSSIIVLMLLPICGTAQTMVGAAAGLLYDIHENRKEFFPTQTSCGSFNGDAGIGEEINFFGRQGFSSRWGIALSIGYQNLSVTMNAAASEHAQEFFQGKLVELERQHELRSTIHALSFTAVAMWKSPLLFDISAGARIALPLKQTYEHSEHIVTPSDLVFSSTGNASRILSSGAISQGSPLLLSPVAVVSHDIVLNNGIVITPSFSSSFPLTALRSDIGWRITSYALGISVGWTFPAHVSLHEEIIPAPPSPQQQLSVAELEVIGRTNNDEQIPVSRVSIYTTDLHEYVPFVPAIFFDEGRSEIPARYNRLSNEKETVAFTPERIPNADAMMFSHEVLNILGKRLADNPRSRVTLDGCVGTTPGELSNAKLAAERAERVKAYITSAWKISPGRITTNARGLPAKPSSVESLQGQEENRRVDILSSDFTLVAPVSTLGKTSLITPPIIEVVPHIPKEGYTGEWKIKIKTKEKTLTEFSGNALSLSINKWNVDRESLGKNDSLVITLMYSDKSGQEHTVEKYIPIIRTERGVGQYKRERQTGVELERYSIITFDFDKAELPAFELKKLDAISESITPEAVIHVKGYTDPSGSEQYNFKLSRDRAYVVADKLKELVSERAIPNVKIDVEGVGPKELFDNALPEGRFLSRTVRVEIIKKNQ